jgi:sulfotransferase famil protein
MAVHIIHIPKSGGSAIRFALREARAKAGGELNSRWGPVWGHDHRFRMVHLEPADMAVFALRDPVSRFISSFYSRLRQGKPRYDLKWTPQERRSFQWFQTPRELADALAEPKGEEHKHAVYAMRWIRHVNRPMTRWLGSPASLYLNRDKVLYVARQESLDDDWERLKELLELPREQVLPKDDIISHRTSYTGDTSISEAGLLALRRWYADDYQVLDFADALRDGREPPAPPIRRRLVAHTERLKPRPKFSRTPESGRGRRKFRRRVLRRPDR